MEEFIVVLIQFLAELVVNVIGSIPFDFPSKKRSLPERDVIWPVNILWFAGGGALGWISTLLVPGAMIHHPGLRLFNLCLSPLVSGGLAYLIAKGRSKVNPLILPRNQFWLAFWFTAGVAVVRFAYMSRV